MKRIKGLFRSGSPAEQTAPSRRAIPEQSRSNTPDPSTSNATPSPVPEPDRSGAEESSTFGKESRSRFKEVKDTALNTLRFSLTLTTAITDSVPVPGLKAVFAGLQVILERFDVNPFALRWR